MASSEILTVIVNYKTPDYVEQCLQALKAERDTGLSLTAIVVDGNSGDGSAQQIADYISQHALEDWIELLPLDFNGGFGWANNQGILHHQSKAASSFPSYVYLLNPDAQVMPGAVATLKGLLDQQPKAGAVGSLLFNSDGSQSGSAFRFPSAGREFVNSSQTFALGRLFGIKPTMIEANAPQKVDWVTGASVMLRSAALQESGLFDDGFFLYFEEVELMHRMQRHGWTIWHHPGSQVVHIGGAATGVDVKGIVALKPDYWFRARARWFSLCKGRGYLQLTNLLWTFGLIFSRMRMLLQPAKRNAHVAGEFAAILRAGFAGKAMDAKNADTLWHKAKGTKPFWTQHQ
jgi:N-acetylglucosaminyl-diphospho-decaprenol L-rhamnosyltransferase